MTIKWSKYLITILTLLWMGVIFHFSAQPAAESAALSGGILYRLQEMMADIPVMGNLFVSSLTDHLIRKAAHMAEYAVLSVLLLLCIREYKAACPFYLQLLAAWLAGTVYAATDEFHQRFVPGRSGEFADVCLDSIGACAGLLVISVILACIRGKKEVY